MDTHIDGFNGVDGEHDVGHRNFERKYCFVWRRNCVSNTWFKSKEKRKVTFIMGENETEIDFVLIKTEHRQFIQNVKAISGISTCISGNRYK